MAVSEQINEVEFGCNGGHAVWLFAEDFIEISGEDDLVSKLMYGCNEGFEVANECLPWIGYAVFSRDEFCLLLVVGGDCSR